MTNQVDPDRHLSVFDPSVWGQRRITMLGCGATGSHLAPEIARLGVQHLELCDFDLIEDVNIANQLYPLTAVGRPKADTLADLIRAGTGLECRLRGRIEGPSADPSEDLGDVVFFAMDTMNGRRDVFENRCRLNPAVQLCIDTRIGVDELRVYAFSPTNLDDCRRYEATLVADEDTVENACAQKTTIGAMAGLVSGLAIKYFLQWFRREIVRDEAYRTTPVPFETLLMLRPPALFTTI